MYTIAKKKWFISGLGSLLVLALLVFGVSSTIIPPAKASLQARTKYIFLFIGDGMGLPQRNAAEIYLVSTEKIATAPGLATETKLVMNTFPAQGMSTTYAADRLITGSAAAATALATGYKTNIGVINLDPTKTKKFKTIAEMAKESGMKIGIISSVSIDHATPAGFYAHQPSRGNYYEIAVEMAKSDFDYFAGGETKC